MKPGSEISRKYKGVVRRLQVGALELAGRHFRDGTEAGPVRQRQRRIGRGKGGEAELEGAIRQQGRMGEVDRWRRTVKA